MPTDPHRNACLLRYARLEFGRIAETLSPQDNLVKQSTEDRLGTDPNSGGQVMAAKAAQGKIGLLGTNHSLELLELDPITQTRRGILRLSSSIV